ncbi:adenylate/guanylate cyclase domain-containing protein [Microvirga terrae]|uniref:Adenylate/guanylate cyclase domain-containing protein n=1 Tax=Microvirga terrae TaxID=2740529 RepID=A0ABY5RNK1_9HYPH|nr:MULTISPECIES: tetratricopeptide repeat protein [Microvirga]MBQ0821685.1 tetratricopeptide repeat protein [Microvirga sp. HBU67558]UVF18820.1 adenylate/guanylate cyclase domain-containing protein [Microvirga terrae]
MSDVDQVAPHRRLGVMLFADIVDYTRLMGDDEIGTWHAVKERLQIFKQLAHECDGEVQQVSGDGLFLLFGSAMAAVGCAMKIQKQMRMLNEGIPEERQILFRIGINLGEILFDDGQVGGDSVNIAARIETYARPGQVCISAAVYDQVCDKLAFGYSYLGAQRLKNVREPVDIFQVQEDATAAAMTTGLRRAATPEQPNRPLVPEASVVVLPFRFQGSDPAWHWLADGFTDDITTSLSRFHDFFVISRNSAYVVGGASETPLHAARELGVRYVVAGTVRIAGKRVRIGIQLIDAERDRTIWGEQYNREFDNILELQEEITQIIVSATAVSIHVSEWERLQQVGPSDLRAYSLVLQGQQHIFHYTRDENRRARLLYESALRVDPHYARAMAAKSRTLNIDWRYSWTEMRDKALDTALNLAQSAIEVDPTDARGFGELGFAHLYRKEHDAALSAYRRALVLNPNDADLMSDMADALAHSGEAAEAVALLDKAKRLNPFYPDQYLWHLGGAFYKLGRYEDAVHTINSMQNPTEGRRILAASYAQLGRLVEAQREAAKILEAHPTFSVERWAAVQPDRLESDTMHFVEGLRKAGL